jgi:hypothetical protein
MLIKYISIFLRLLLVVPVPLSTMAPQAVTNSTMELPSETKPTRHVQMSYRF